ncbi:MAG TPA: SdpI family protein [Polyangiaceae bacterium]|nr:SdpI family protein [Polyangiaceae bacterium]
MALQILATFLIASGVLVVVALPLVLGKIPPNGLYGLRLEATLEDSTVWYEANRVAGRDLLLVAAASVALSLLCAFAWHIGDVHSALLCSGALSGGVIVAGVRGARFARRRQRERRGG